MKWKRGLSLGLCLLLLMPFWPVSARAASTPRMEFTASKPDASGQFTVTLTAYDMVYRAFQFGIRFNPQVIEPVDEKGAVATSFSGFGETCGDWMITAGLSVDAKTGFFGFSGLIMPGTKGDKIAANGEMTVGSDGVALFTFRFRTLKSGDPQLAVATKEKGEPYEHALPEGALVLNDTEKVGARLHFDCTALAAGAESSDSSSTAQPGQDTGRTAQQRLQGSVILQIGNYAAAKDGALCHIYPGEKSITPYLTKANRTMVPLRFISEALGAEVEWEAATATAVIRESGKTVRMTIGKKGYTVDGTDYSADEAPQLVRTGQGYGARTMVPMRFISEALGRSVVWDGENQLVIVTPGGDPWNLTGTAEQEAVANVLTILSPLLRDFV